MIPSLLSLLSLFSLTLSSAPPIYHNHAVWFIGNTTSAPPHPDPSPLDNGLITLINRCDFPLYIWESRDRYQDPAPTPLPPRSRTSYPIKPTYPIPGAPDTPCLDNCGVTYKLAASPALVGGAGGNQNQLEYATRGGKIYYDASFVDCATVTGYRRGDARNCPAWSRGVEVVGRSSSGECKRLVCGEGEMCIHDGQGAYYIDDPTEKWGLGAPIGTCPSYKAGTEIVYVLCASAAPI